MVSGAVHRELHVAGAGRLLAGRGDLFRQVGRGIDALTVLHVEVGQEHHLEKFARPARSRLTTAATPLIKRMISLAIR